MQLFASSVYADYDQFFKGEKLDKNILAITCNSLNLPKFSLVITFINVKISIVL